jgi:hypothetical protein
MKAGIWTAAIVSMLFAGASPVVAQDATSTPPPAKQSAPADASHSSGHDVQTGQPETGEIEKNEPRAGSGQTKKDAETTGGASTERLDVSPNDLKYERKN